MQLEIFDAEKVSKGKVELPVQFDESVSPDLIARAVVTLQANKRQPYGASPDAGTRVSAQVSRRRKNYRGAYGKGISRVPRKVVFRRGTQFSWIGALAPGTVKGRRAHPPRARMRPAKINKKEYQKAVRSALAATVSKDFVEKRGHKVPDYYPFAVNDSLESLDKTKIVRQALEKLGLIPELKRVSKRTIRPGKGKTRGRKYRVKSGPLIVVGNDCALQKSAANLNVDVVAVDMLDAEMLAPGSTPGRLTLFTPSALEKMKKERMFT